jgi:hypothetical protein
MVVDPDGEEELEDEDELEGEERELEEEEEEEEEDKEYNVEYIEVSATKNCVALDARLLYALVYV